ncbi:hypothetical protein Syun_017095 [Stephania yunnanensis]|uniref:Uncharacterized protein n=1 Tax=Stephania yunnanensis TaxID=152371 RepID=A0AAP0J8J0_9MAGN
MVRVPVQICLTKEGLQRNEGTCVTRVSPLSITDPSLIFREGFSMEWEDRCHPCVTRIRRRDL